MSRFKLTLTALCLLGLSSCSTPQPPAVPRLPTPPAGLLTPPRGLILVPSPEPSLKTTATPAS